MRGRCLRMLLGVLLMVLIVGCGANLRYSQVAPEAKNFHPKRIAVFPVDVKGYPEAGGVIDQIISTVLVDRGWFADVVSADGVKKLMGSNEEFKKAVTEYLQKLQTVNFSDPDLSRKIGQALPGEAFLVVQVDEWNYVIQSDDKVAKVGLEIRLVEAETGKIIWKASHDELREYRFFKPALPAVARSVARDMISCMPH
jgi:hypothetical protein